MAHNVSGNGSELKDYAASIEKTSKIVAIVIVVASALAGAMTHALLGAFAGFLVGAALAFAFITISSNIAKLFSAIGDVDDNIAVTTNKVNALDEKLEETTSEISKNLKDEIKNIKVTAAPVETKKEKVEAKETPVEKKAEPAIKKQVEEKPVEARTAFKSAAPVEEEPKEPEHRKLKTVKVSDLSKEDIERFDEEEEAQLEAPKKTFTPIPAPKVQEEKKSPFASAPAPVVDNKEEPKEEPASPFARANKKESSSGAPAKKGSLYRCDVCGNMVNVTPCPRCAAKNKNAAKAEEAPVEAETEAKEEKSSIWAAATKPATASELANNASAFKKKEELTVDDIPETPIEKKEEFKNEPTSPFSAPKAAEESKPETVTVKKGALYRCKDCGNMVNATPCPRCLIKSRKAGAAKPNEEAAAAKKEEEPAEDVNPIWAAATKPDGSFGPTGGSKLMESNAALAPSSSPLKAGETATEAPSWAKPAPGISESKQEEEESVKPVAFSTKPAAPAPTRPIWEKADEEEAPAPNGATPSWML